MIVEIIIRRDSGEVVIRQMGSAFHAIQWVAPPDGEIVEIQKLEQVEGALDGNRMHILKGFTFYPHCG